jgi:hypothetical protein
MQIENFKAIKRWTLPDSYCGATWEDYFVFLGQSRDSSTLERSNFECGLEALGGECEGVIVVRENHWAVGWVEWIAIHKDNSEALEAADEMLCALSDYPILNESHFSELELSEAENYWQQLPIRYRVELCQEAGVSVFAARHDWLPSEDSGYIYERCAGC